MKARHTIPAAIALLVLSGCAQIEDGSIKPPLVYRIDIQQGNVVDQTMINKLQVGMDKKQVRFIMGTPLLIDPFHDERWEYLYTFQEGGRRRQKRHITLYFEDDKLAYIRGDIKVSHIPSQDDETNTEKSVVVPENVNNKTLLERWLSDSPAETDSEQVEDTPASAVIEGGSSDLETAEPETGIKTPPDKTAEEESVADTEDAMPDAETGTDGGGFFSNIWDKLSGKDKDTQPADAEVLQPELESR